MGAEIAELEPKIVWEFFHEITKYPRPSKKEEKIVAYCEQLAKDLNLPLKKDDLGNIVITKPATPGMEDKQGFCIQAHLDMVTEKNRDVEFDFDNDPIQTWIDGDWVKAKGTTLGADNGMGVAMGMAILASKDIKHPRFELLLTLDEETGLTGAMQLGTDLLESDILINLDTEDDHTFSIGCAGGINTIGRYPINMESLSGDYAYYEIGIKGLMGGHSGVEIHEERGAATKFITRLLFDLTNKFGVRVASIDSGSKHNAIPREAFAKCAIPADKVTDVIEFVKEHDSVIKKEYKSVEANVSSFATKIDAFGDAIESSNLAQIIQSFYAMPHGIIRWSPDIKGLVQTSTNFAVVETKADHIEILTSQRSSVESEKYNLANQIQAVIELGGGTVEFGDGYPSWEPNMDSNVLNLAKELHAKRFGFEPTIEAIHAGLECGLIGERYPNLDMLSFGPTIKEPHTPDEKCQISTVRNCWDLLVDIVENIPAK
jgi:dipeptidase D